MYQRRGHQEGLSKLRLNDLGGTPLRRTTLELVGVTGRIGFDRHRRNILSPLDQKLCSCGQCGIDRGVQWSAARVRLVAQPLALEDCAQIAEQHRGIVAVRLIQLEKPETTAKDILRSGEARPRQHGREYAGARRLPGLHSLGQCTVQDALAIAGRVAVSDAEGSEHLLRRQLQQLACGRRGAEDADGRCAMPAAIERACQRDAARDIESQRNRQQELLSGDSAKAVAYG